MISSSELKDILDSNGFDPVEVDGRVGLMRIDIDRLWECAQCLPGHKTPQFSQYGDGTVTVVFGQEWEENEPEKPPQHFHINEAIACGVQITDPKESQ